MNPRIPVAIQTIWLLTVIPAAGLAVLLLISTATLPGALVGFGVLIFWLAFPWVDSRRTGIRWFNRLGIGFGLASLLAAWVLVPSGNHDENACFVSVYDGPAKFRSWVPSQLVPEIDQHLMGSRVFTALDPFIDGGQAKSLRHSLEQIYLPMRTDNEFANAGNAMGICYHSLAFGQRRSGHRYEYVPKSGNGEGMPVVLLLHGSLGNFKGYLWVWKRFADANGVAIVAPSFGRGEWREDGGIRVIADAFEQCANNPRFDPQQIYLAGLSNGGAGVTISIPEIGNRVAGLIYLSPVLEHSAVNRPEILKRLESIPVLMISGRDDRRIPVTALEATGAKLKNNGTRIETHFIGGEDHFLFFSQAERVTDLISTWFQARSDEPARLTPSVSADPAK